jgi:hypothetical protein
MEAMALRMEAMSAGRSAASMRPRMRGWAASSMTAWTESWRLPRPLKRMTGSGERSATV